MDSGTTTMTPLCDRGFKAFPHEVSEMIFKNDLAGVWIGQTPALILALRPSELYCQDEYFQIVRWKQMESQWYGCDCN